MPRWGASPDPSASSEDGGKDVFLHISIIESGGDNLAAAFSPELADRTIYVIDVAEGDKIPRKGGPGIMRSDLLVMGTHRRHGVKRLWLGSTTHGAPAQPHWLRERALRGLLPPKSSSPYPSRVSSRSLAKAVSTSCFTQ